MGIIVDSSRWHDRIKFCSALWGAAAEASHSKSNFNRAKHISACSRGCILNTDMLSIELADWITLVVTDCCRTKKGRFRKQKVKRIFFPKSAYGIKFLSLERKEGTTVQTATVLYANALCSTQD